MYVRIYAPDGEPFDVPRERANRLILDKGWTQTKPTISAPEEEPDEDGEIYADSPADAGEDNEQEQEEIEISED